MLVINLRDPEMAFAPGDEVAGQVIFQPDSSHSHMAVRVLVDLVGRTKVKIRGNSGERKSTYRGRASLLRTIVADMQGMQTVWPFAFSFPATASPVDPEVADTRSLTNRMKTIAPNHPLPPTFSQTFGLNFSPAHECSVEYAVRASVWPMAGGKSVCEQVVPVNFEPRCDLQDSSGEVSLVQQDYQAKSLLLLPENKDRNLTFREKTKSLFNRSKLPSFDFKLEYAVPARIHVGLNIPFTIRIEPSPETSTAPEIPKFTLVHFRVVLQAKTCVYVAALMGDRESEKMDIFHDLKRKDLGDFSPHEGYTKTVTVAPLTDIPLSFTTYNIQREYHLMTSATVECAGGKFRVLNAADVVILPALRGFQTEPQQTEIECVDGLLPSRGDMKPEWASPKSGFLKN